jgi:hypothetical protein
MTSSISQRYYLQDLLPTGKLGRLANVLVLALALQTIPIYSGLEMTGLDISLVAS